MKLNYLKINCRDEQIKDKFYKSQRYMFHHGLKTAKLSNK